MAEWKCFVGEEHTFYGIYHDYYSDFEEHWKADSTQRSNHLRYCNQIIPLLPDHDGTPISAYTQEDYDAVIEKLIKRGQDTKSKQYLPYKESTLQDFRRLIYYVVETAARHGECDNVLWESSLNPEVTTGSDEIRANQALLSKSLTIQQEQAVAKMLLSDPLQFGQNMGLLLMYSLGLRNAEACAVDFGDIKPMQTHPECPVVWIYKTTGYDTSAGKLGGKTKNADRIIPLPDKVAALIHTRRQHMESQLNKSIDDYPIVCNGDRWDVRCSARELTNAARVLFQSIKMKAAQLASINEDMQDESVSPNDDLPFEDRKDPTAYLFRRNFGTHMHILGLTEPEIEYVIGHDIDDPYETRNEFVNEEKLFTIKQKMDRRPLVNSDQSELGQSVQVGELQPLQHTSHIRIPANSTETELHIAANEPTDNIKIKLAAQPQSMRVRLKCRHYMVKVAEYDRFVDTHQQYRKVYEKEKAGNA